MSPVPARTGGPRTHPGGRGGPVEGLPDRGLCAVMGVVNVTPDSFSDGGRRFNTAAGVAHGVDLAAQGADLVDVGGESTRPGASRVDEEEELRRMVPVVRGPAAEGVLVSVGTMRASVAARAVDARAVDAGAVDAGAVLVNDVSGGLADPGTVPAVAAGGVPFVVMHWRGFGRDMNGRAVYGDVVREVVAELGARCEAVVAAGIPPERLVVDPGLGFAKRAEHDLGLVAGLDRLRAPGRPVLVAGSRKRFLGHVLADAEGVPPPAGGRDQSHDPDRRGPRGTPARRGRGRRHRRPVGDRRLPRRLGRQGPRQSARRRTP